MARPVPPHGTYARYQREHKYEGGPCDACKRAYAVYVAQWRRDRKPGRGPADTRFVRLGPDRCVGGLGWPA